MKIDKRWLYLSLVNIIVILCLEMVNHALGIYHMQVVIYGIFGVYAALYLPLRPGFISMLITGLVLEAKPGMPCVGVCTLVFIFCLVSYIDTCRGLKSERAIHLLLQISNLFYWCISMLYGYPNIGFKQYMVSGFINIGLSSLVIIILWRWYFDLQTGLLINNRYKLKRDNQESI